MQSDINYDQMSTALEEVENLNEKLKAFCGLAP